MKTWKKLLTILCLAALVFAVPLSGAVNAAATYTLTLSNTGATPHTFEIYQIFCGDLSVNAGGQKVLSNIVWGSGVTAGGQTALGNAADKAETVLTESDAVDFADELISNSYLTGALTRTISAGGSDTVTGLAPGYYLIKDQDATQAVPGGAYTAYLLEVVGDVTATTKLDAPTVEKKVQDINDTLDGNIADNPWQDSADHDIGDTIPYQIVGTLPSNFADYASYYYAFTDTMSSGLTYQADARIFVDNGGTETEITSQATVSPSASAAGATLSIVFSDLKALTGVSVDQNSRIVVRYTAILNDNAVIGGAGNPNTVILTYSNDPNPGGSGITTTPPDKTVVFTYQFVINKVDENGLPLENAGFTLYKKDSLGAWQLVKTIAPGTATTFTFSGLDDGDYKLVESAVPEGYNRLDDLEFSITAVHDALSADPDLISLNGAAADGTVITLSGTQQASVSPTTGTIGTTIMNKAGSVLPSTGGIGTTIFYAVGGTLLVAAVVLLLAKKRMKSKD